MVDAPSIRGGRAIRDFATEAKAVGAAEERAAIVEWLRKENLAAVNGDVAHVVGRILLAISRGEHHEG